MRLEVTKKLHLQFVMTKLHQILLKAPSGDVQVRMITDQIRMPRDGELDHCAHRMSRMSTYGKD